MQYLDRPVRGLRVKAEGGGADEAPLGQYRYVSVGSVQVSGGMQVPDSVAKQVTPPRLNVRGFTASDV